MIGLSPELRPTHSRIKRLCPDMEYIEDRNTLVREEELNEAPTRVKKIYAARYLMEKYDESGVLVKPNIKEAPEYAKDSDMEQEVS